jgi:ketosteroid isomerase-like protein
MLEVEGKIMGDESALIKQVLNVERRWVAAHRALDLDAIGDILADDYRQIQANGSIIGKDELIDSYKSGLRRWDIADSDEYDVRLHGDVALVIGRWRGVGENYGEPFDYSARFLAVYRLEAGEWKLVSDVSVPIEE